MKRNKSIVDPFIRIQKSLSVKAIRHGLVTMIPILMIGSFSLILKTMPIKVYQDFITTAFSGIILDMLNFVYDSTFGLLSIYIAFTISACYISAKNFRNNYVFGGSMTSVACFFILSGIKMSDISADNLGAKGMFTAIITAVIVSKIFTFILSNRKTTLRVFADGTDIDFNDAFFVTFPAAMIIIVFVLFNWGIKITFGVESFHDLYIMAANKVFISFGRSFTSGLLFVVIINCLWFFGIHGSDVLEGATQAVFKPALQVNINLLANQKEPTEIFTKQFFDLFILIGGCGTSLCLLVAILIFSKRRSNKNLAKFATFPMLFNINELMVFGFPIIYNTYMLIPFVLTPVVCFLVSFIAFHFGWVPLVTNEVEWTTPILLSGYKATGSLAGSVLQLVNLVIGTLVYLPFLKTYDKEMIRIEHEKIDELIAILKENEKNNKEVALTELRGKHGVIAKSIVSDIKIALEEEKIEIHYQPQFDNRLQCIGAEALLRYKHPIHGFLYPPLVIKIAREAGILKKLEKYVFLKVAKDLKVIRKNLNSNLKISVNVTVATLLEIDFVKFLEKLKHDNAIKDSELCIEVTEQMAIQSDHDFSEVLTKIKNYGYLVAIDDFSMGYTSVKYLQTNQFDIVKVDGNIVKDMIRNNRSRDIISSIVYLAKSLDFTVLAEYVETREQMEELEKIGCLQYQGYYYSKAIPLDEFEEYLK